MTEDEEEILSNGLNEMHDKGAVHASDLQRMMKFIDYKEKPFMQGFSGENFLKAMSIKLVFKFN